MKTMHRATIVYCMYLYIYAYIYVWWLKIASATSNKPEYKSDYILALNCDFTYNNKQNCAFAYHSTRRIQRVTVCRGSPQIRIYIYFSHCRSSRCSRNIVVIPFCLCSVLSFFLRLISKKLFCFFQYRNNFLWDASAQINIYIYYTYTCVCVGFKINISI